MNPREEFLKECQVNIKSQGKDADLKTASLNFIKKSHAHKYSYNFSWMGRPIIQYPQDMMAMQELIWSIKPDLLIETGVAHGGSLIYYSSLMELIGKGEVLGIDIDIRKHNRQAIEEHPMFKRISLLEGSSIADETLHQVEAFAKNKKTIMVCLDSNHTHDHVLAEMKLYSKFVSLDSYLVVFDTIVEYASDEFSKDRPWGKRNNPMSAVEEFLKENKSFKVNEEIDDKLLISVAPKGYLKRIS